MRAQTFRLMEMLLGKPDPMEKLLIQTEKNGTLKVSVIKEGLPDAGC